MKYKPVHILASASLLVAFAGLFGGCQLVPELFNEDTFLTDIGASTGEQGRVRPGIDSVILVRLTNNTGWPANFNLRVLRPSGIQRIEFEGAQRTVGELIRDCEDDPPAIIRLQFLGEDSTQPGVEANLLFPDAFVLVLGVPTLISRSPPPLELGVDFECGDTIEYIVRAVPGNDQKFEIIVGVFRGTNEPEFF